MLVLSRKANQSIVIDGRITVTVIELRGNQIRLGIDAPRVVPVLREELMLDKPEPTQLNAESCVV